MLSLRTMPSRFFPILARLSHHKRKNSKNGSKVLLHEESCGGNGVLKRMRDGLLRKGSGRREKLQQNPWKMAKVEHRKASTECLNSNNEGLIGGEGRRDGRRRRGSGR
ncbi:hypothetical protein V8G54_002558 [Vigna mungo]|uniref:Uncharacterized protein n=1 Tax=Vigna mungo TaxID=3915 RepID=A0AAQ3PA80_VIGMU